METIEYRTAAAGHSVAIGEAIPLTRQALAEPASVRFEHKPELALDGIASRRP
ncbi:hypothetical protein [Rhizohabitans arisaemae]|uniref:hypothetical protein n=1 Tax=Rhizohabitans arisaemae TaxID=2720610 RepID=UPI0024B226B3|nr:hypothetical protein [Rhizohabitans arisaemae]